MVKRYYYDIEIYTTHECILKVYVERNSICYKQTRFCWLHLFTITKEINAKLRKNFVMWNLNLLLSILMVSTNCEIGKKFVMHLFWFYVNGLFLMDKYYKILSQMFSGTYVNKLSTCTSFIYSSQINE